MVEGPVSWASSLLDFLRWWILFALACLLCMRVVHWIRVYLSKRAGLKWFFSALFATFIFVTVLAGLMYVLPQLAGAAESSAFGVTVPEALAPKPAENFSVLLQSLLRILLFSASVTLLVMPLEFVAAYAYRYFAKNQKPVFAWPLAAAVTGLVALLFFMVFPFVFFGLVYMLYWGI